MPLAPRYAANEHTVTPRSTTTRDDDELDIDARAVNSKAARELYKKREQIYPKLAHGTFRNLKWAAMVVLLAIYYITPWMRWDRGDSAGPIRRCWSISRARRFYFFFIELWPQEVYYITGLLILAAFGIFLSSALFGRVWCGYACPQTVWTDLYIHVERWIEGDRNARMRLDKAPLSLSKAAKKISQARALARHRRGDRRRLGVLFRRRADACLRDIFTGQASVAVYLFIGLLTFTTYALAGTMREQVCTYLCPWPRIQAAMIDKDALSVTYRADRGEPRGAAQEGRKLGRARRLHRLPPMRRGVPARHRHSRRRSARMHQLRALHRRLRRDHGQGRPARLGSSPTIRYANVERGASTARRRAIV